MNLEPLQPNESCPKCGAAEPTIEYHEGFDPATLEGHVLAPIMLAFLRERSHEPIPEHLCVTCTRCRYSWKRACLTPATPKPVVPPVDPRAN